MSDSIMKFRCITPDIVHITLPDRKSLASCMVRIQEYYESPFPEIRGKIFTLGQLRAMGSRNNPGVYTYEGGNFYDADWSGYNWPSYCLEPFVNGLFDPLTPYEQDMVDALKYKQGRYYVIGTYGEDDPGDSLDHEICHALYYVDNSYKSEVDELLLSYKEEVEPLKRCLLSWGYAETVLDDEVHAYMSADYHWFFDEKRDDVIKFGIAISEDLHKELRSIKHRHFKG